MVPLSDLLKLKGVIAAAEFTSDGDVVEFKSNMEMGAD